MHPQVARYAPPPHPADRQKAHQPQHRRTHARLPRVRPKAPTREQGGKQDEQAPVRTHGMRSPKMQNTQFRLATTKTRKKDARNTNAHCLLAHASDLHRRPQPPFLAHLHLKHSPLRHLQQGTPARAGSFRSTITVPNNLWQARSFFIASAHLASKSDTRDVSACFSFCSCTVLANDFSNSARKRRTSASNVSGDLMSPSQNSPLASASASALAQADRTRVFMFSENLGMAQAHRIFICNPHATHMQPTCNIRSKTKR